MSEKRRLTDKTPEELSWDDLGPTAYTHWQHMRSHICESYDTLCHKTVDIVIENMSQEEKDNVVKKTIFESLRNKPGMNYSKVAKMLIASGNENVVDEVGIKPKDFCADEDNKMFSTWKIDLETGYYEAPVEYPDVVAQDHVYNNVTQQWVKTEDWGEQLPQEEKKSWYQMREERLEICSGCEYNERRIGTNWCSECGCIIPVKTAAPWMSCPMKKWNSMWSDEQEQEYGIKRQNS